MSTLFGNSHTEADRRFLSQILDLTAGTAKCATNDNQIILIEVDGELLNAAKPLQCLRRCDTVDLRVTVTPCLLAQLQRWHLVELFYGCGFLSRCHPCHDADCDHYGHPTDQVYSTFVWFHICNLWKGVSRQSDSTFSRISSELAWSSGA